MTTKKLTVDERKMLRELASASTRVVAWYAHGPENEPEATVRGPFCRWMRVSEVAPQYRKHVSEGKDDARFAAAAMNNLVPLLDTIEILEAEKSALEAKLAVLISDRDEARKIVETIGDKWPLVLSETLIHLGYAKRSEK